MADEKCFAYVSSWTHGEGAAGLALYRWDAAGGALTFIRQLDENTDFGVSAVDTKRNVLYILDESADLPGRHGGGGRAFAYRIDPESGGLTELSCVQTGCANPSYLTLDATGRYLVVSNHGGKSFVTRLVRDAFGKYHPQVEYDDAAVELFAVGPDGAIGEMLDAVRHEGSGPDPKKQTNAHPHCAVMSPSGRLFAVCDKGSDRVSMYTIDRERGRLVPAGTVWVCPPGSEPRFGVFHPSLPYFYHNNEGVPAVSAYRYDEDGGLAPIGIFDSLTPENAAVKGERVHQGICLDRAGDFLYGVMHDPALAVVYQIDRGSGALRLVQNLRLDAVWPRGCALSPDGRFLLVTGMKSGNILTLAVGADGLLAYTGLSAPQPGAAHITFFRKES